MTAKETTRRTSKMQTEFVLLFEKLAGRAPTLDEIHSEAWQRLMKQAAIFFLPLMKQTKGSKSK
jgi:hypothetical protein